MCIRVSKCCGDRREIKTSVCICLSCAWCPAPPLMDRDMRKAPEVPRGTPMEDECCKQKTQLCYPEAFLQDDLTGIEVKRPSACMAHSGTP